MRLNQDNMFPDICVCLEDDRDYCCFSMCKTRLSMKENVTSSGGHNRTPQLDESSCFAHTYGVTYQPRRVWKSWHKSCDLQPHRTTVRRQWSADPKHTQGLAFSWGCAELSGSHQRVMLLNPTLLCGVRVRVFEACKLCSSWRWSVVKPIIYLVRLIAAYNLHGNCRCLKDNPQSHALKARLIIPTNTRRWRIILSKNICYL